MVDQDPTVEGARHSKSLRPTMRKRALNYDDSCAKRQIPGCARLTAAEAADLACREDPLDFQADKRGRTRQVFDSILEGARLGSDETFDKRLQWS